MKSFSCVKRKKKMKRRKNVAKPKRYWLKEKSELGIRKGIENL